MTRFTYLFLSTLILSLAFACQKNKDIKPMPASAQAYVLAYDQGIIDRKESVDIQFAGLVVEEDKIGTEVEGNTFSISPSVAGQWTWTDRQQISFTPDNPFDFSKEYIISIKLADLFDNVPSEAEVFEFGVRTRDPFLSIQLDGLITPDLNERNKQVLKGKVKTSDFISESIAKDILHVQQAGEVLPVTWSANAAGTEHAFTISNIARASDASSVVINWNGAVMDAAQKGKETIDVPAIGDFKVSKVEAFGGRNPRVDIYFSDPLDERQQFEGLVNIENYSGQLNYQANGHIISVYLSKNITGDRKLKVFTGIKNFYKESMPKASFWDVSFETVDPEVRLLGNGNILPSSGKLVFPFEAVGLHTVEVEVFKIYSNNILQFLQTNSLDGRDEMTRVGKVIYRGEVQLEQISPDADHLSWSNYALDLNEFFATDAKAIYQVRIGFRPTHSLTSCNPNQNFEFVKDSWRDSDDLLSSWYGIEGYYQEYRWDQRDDPCYPAYYNSDRFISRNVLTSNIGLIVKAGTDNNYHTVVSDLRNANPMAGVMLKYYDLQQQLLSSSTSDDNGFSVVSLDEPPYFVVAETDTDQVYLRLQDGEALSLSRFDVAGTNTKEGLKGFIYGERGVWRPGDSLFLNFVLEDDKGLLPPAYPVSMELRDARGQLVVDRNGILPEGRIYPLYIATQKSDPTGLWEVKVLVGNAQFTKNIRVETVKPNRIKMDLAFAEDPIRLFNGQTSSTLNASWLHGAPANQLKAIIEASTSVHRSEFKQFPGFSFVGTNKNSLSRNQVVFDGTTDENGKARFELKLPNHQQMAGPLTMNLRTRVFERGGNFSTDNQQLIIYPFNYYAGVIAPKNKYGTPRVNIEEAFNIDLAAADYKGNPASGRTLKAKLYRLDWRWWWDDVNSNRRSGYNRERTQELIAETQKNANTEGLAKWNVKVEKWGRYLIQVCDSGSGHCAETYVYAGSPWYNEQSFSEEATILTFQADREEYKTGEEVQLTFPASSNGRALLSLENGSGVLEERWLETKAGDNTYTFETTKEMAPTVYASLTVLQAHEQEENDMPLRTYGVIPITVTDAETRLNPSVKTADEWMPEKTFTVEVAEDEGKPMTYTLAVVDEGLLGLTRFKTPNPHDEFFAREALGVKSWDLYNYVIGRHNTQLDKILSIGGDGELAASKEAKRANRFDPVVIHLGPFDLPKNGTAKHNIQLPNYIGAVRVMVVAAGDGAYGAIDKSIPVRKPLMVLATLPRVLSIGETLEIPANVFAMKDGLGRIKIRLSESSDLVSLLDGNQEITLNKQGDGLVKFPITVGANVGIAKFVISAEAGSEKARQEIEIDIRNPNPYQTLVDRYVLKPGEQITPVYTPFGSAGTQSGVLEVSHLPPIDLERQLNYLISYPYGCLEQSVSSGFAQLHLSRFMELTTAKEQETRDNVAASIQRLRNFQLTNGGFSYWPGQGETASWATNYAGHFLLEAKEAGYTVPSNMINNWIGFQQKSARQWDGQLIALGHVDRRSYELDQAYRLYTLALAGKPEMGAMNRLREQPKLQMAASWRLAATYALAGQIDIAREISARLDQNVLEYRELGSTFGSTLRDKAMILESLIAIDKEETAAELVEVLASALSSKSWLSTHEVAYSLLALSKYLGDGNQVSDTFTFTYQQSGGAAIDAGATHPYMMINLKNRESEILVNNTSTQNLFVNLIRTGQPLPSEEQAYSNLLSISVKYLDANGAELDVKALPQGTDFIAEVNITHPGILNYSYEEMALEQVFPAGWEITNSRFEGGYMSNESAYTYRDFRDDRVHTFFNLGNKMTNTFRVYLSATYTGSYYLPAVRCSAMYNDKIQASSAGYWVEVLEPADSIE